MRAWTALAAAVLLLAAPMAVQAARFCEEEVEPGFRLLYVPPDASGPGGWMSVRFLQPGEHKYGASWEEVDPRAIATTAPFEFTYEVDWRPGAPPPAGSSIHIFLDGREVARVDNAAFSSQPDAAGIISPLRAPNAPNLVGHRKLRIEVIDPSGKTVSDKSFALPDWLALLPRIRQAAARVERDARNSHGLACADASQPAW